MKKFLFAAILGLATLVASSQTLVTVYAGRSGTTDTLTKSVIQYSTVVNINYSNVQSLNVQASIDSVSGAPAGHIVMQHSTDAIHWTVGVGDTICTWTNTGWAIHGANTGDTMSNITFQKAYSNVTDAYVRFITYTTSATQRSRQWLKVKASNYNH